MSPASGTCQGWLLPELIAHRDRVWQVGACKADAHTVARMSALSHVDANPEGMGDSTLEIIIESQQGLGWKGP